MGAVADLCAQDVLERAAILTLAPASFDGAGAVNTGSGRVVLKDSENRKSA